MSIKSYLLQDLNELEKVSYKNYINGKKNDTIWMEKSLNRRESIILKNPECHCGSPINIDENGVCKCIKNHNCQKIILKLLKTIS